MKIAFSGAQCSGKTTLFNELSSIYYFDKFTKCKEIVRSINKLGININEMGDDLTQRMISNTHLYNIISNKNLITDRCAWDSHVYSLWLFKRGKINRETLEISKNIMEYSLKKLDIIFFTPAEFDLVEDGIRSVDIEFRNEINGIFEEMGPSLNTYCDSIWIGGDIETRKNNMFEIIEQIIPGYKISKIEENYIS